MAARKKPDDGSFVGSVHMSTSNMMSYSLVTMAAMLAFYFAFQAGLLTGYAYLYEKFLTATYRGWPIGKAVPVFLLALIVVFNIWSYKIVRVFISYFFAFIEAGANLERAANLMTESRLYGKMLAVYRRPGRHENLFIWTAVFFIFNSLFWLMLGIWPLLQ